MARKEGEVVCVTGASGFIGSELIRQLLDRGYTVHGTVQDLKNENETGHLEALEGAESRLRLFQMDLLDYDSVFAAIKGTVGIFHVASPNITVVKDPERDLLAPAVKGTQHVLTAAKELGIRRVVVTSSITAITPNKKWPSDVPVSEDCWADEEYCQEHGLWYSVSKIRAEKAAWEFAKERGLEVVVINPGAVFGHILPPTINLSMSILLNLVEGSTETLKDFHLGVVHVKDVALAHILVYENTSATGRHLCVESISHFSDLAVKLSELYPEYKNVPSLPKDTQPGILRYKNGAKKLMDLGLQFHNMDQVVKDSIESLKSKGFLK
ncbi:hypothetical protein U1Q18_033543 [Sarracenia purpurea var. burkii]